MNLFWILKVLWIFFGEITNEISFRGHFLCILESFLNVNVQNGYIVLCCKKSKYFFGCLIFLIYFWVFSRC